MLSGPRSRGRHGNALQWHLGLSSHDSEATLDWEDRIEIKLVSVWRRSDGSVGCDKLKVCDAGVDPRHKLSNVLWVFADRMTRVVVGHRFTCLEGAMRERLVDKWSIDPHFGEPSLFIESRESGDEAAPAYYLARRWLEDEGLLPDDAAGIYRFDAKWWSEARKGHGGKDPLITVVSDQTHVACPRCGGPIEVPLDRLGEQGWAPVAHRMPLGPECAVAGHLAVDGSRLCRPSGCSPEEMVAGIQRSVPRDRVWRLADRVLEPDDHLH